MIEACGVRRRWTDLPIGVRTGVQDVLADRVVEAVSQSGGFSPGTADRVSTASGGRAFVKAVSSEQNDYAPQLHRREAVVTAALPAGTPAPRLLGTYDDGIWIALVFEDVDGSPPVTPWRADQVTATSAPTTCWYVPTARWCSSTGRGPATVLPGSIPSCC